LLRLRNTGNTSPQIQCTAVNVYRTSELKRCLPVWIQSAALGRLLAYVAVVLYRSLWAHFCVGLEAVLGRRILCQIYVRSIFYIASFEVSLHRRLELH